MQGMANALVMQASEQRNNTNLRGRRRARE